MAIELLPLLDAPGGPEEPGGPYVPPTSTTHQETADTLAAYLDSANPDLRPTSLALQAVNWARSIYAALTSPDGALRSGMASLVDLVNALGDGLTALGDGLTSSINSITDALGGTGAPTISDRVDAVATAALDAAWWSAVVFDPTAPWWVLVDTDTFTDSIHFEADAHVYLIDLIAPIKSRSNEVIDGETIYFGAGWACEMNGDYRGQRGYVDFAKNLYHREGTLMRGCLVNLPKGGDGQISGYRYQPT